MNHPSNGPSPPDTAFLIGAQKAGTTALAALLDQHPQVVLARDKEPHYFSMNYGRGEAWYDACFADRPGALRLDASTTYSVLPKSAAADEAWGRHVPARIKARHPDARFLYLVRHPVDRAVSSYWHEVRAGREHLPLERAFAENPYYLGSSRYAERLERFLDEFDRERFLVLDFTALTRDHVGTARACARHLGVDPEFAFRADVPRNRSVRYTFPVRVARTVLGSERRLLAIAGAVRRAVPAPVLRLLERALTRPTERLPADLRARLTETFVEDVGRLRELTGLPLLSELLGETAVVKG